MPLKDQIQNYALKRLEDVSQIRDLKASALRKPDIISRRFADDGIVPNNPQLPLVLYRTVLKAGRHADLAPILDHLFEENGWGRSWRATIYDFVHYHSQVHEVLGVAQGSAKVEFGGVKGALFKLKAGDVAILPAGTGHRLLEASKDFLVVGAYPETGSYDECTDSRERPDAKKRIAKVRLHSILSMARLDRSIYSGNQSDMCPRTALALSFLSL